MNTEYSYFSRGFEQIKSYLSVITDTNACIKVKSKYILNQLESEINTTHKKTSGSEIAKVGFEEEILLTNNLNNDLILREKLCDFLKIEHLGTFKKIKGNGKIDISDSGHCRIQVKRSKADFNQFQRLWVEELTNQIPELKSIQYILKNLCEKPLKPCGKLVDRTKTRIKLDEDTYSQEELSNFIHVLNQNKKKLLEYVWFGKENDKPNVLIVTKINKDEQRKKLIVYNLSELIEYFCTFTFKISPKKTTIRLCNENDSYVILIQRKGGDSGKKCANHIQFKLKASKITYKNKLEYIL